MHEITLNMGPYALTQQIFSNYSVPMNTELTALEEKIRQTIQLCRRLRDENSDLRQQVVKLESDRKRLSDKIDGAATRVESLLARFPE
jgi:cell division protein ZapB